ncbi:hypothetical protein C2G38_2086130 [Gigaspora rosea]|uniref:Uncharacterized protein n=1 Tax=Gigaspora rosea TaxID=44941 RepID=A0A397VEA6_9GLOM|nr:hypothetical protein C2G38_2086130 [Gigaspora rosea]
MLKMLLQITNSVPIGFEIYNGLFISFQNNTPRLKRFVFHIAKLLKIHKYFDYHLIY